MKKRILVSIMIILNIFTIPVYGVNISTETTQDKIAVEEQVIYKINFDETVLTADLKLNYDASKLEYIGTNTEKLEAIYFNDENCLQVLYADESGIGTNQIQLIFKAKDLAYKTPLKIQEINVHTVEKQESFNITDENEINQIEIQKISIIQNNDYVEDNSEDDTYPGTLPKAGYNLKNIIIATIGVIVIIAIIIVTLKFKKVLPVVIIILVSGFAVKSDAMSNILIKEYNKIKGYENIVVIMPDSTNRNIASDKLLNEVNLPSKVSKIENNEGEEINGKQNIGTGAILNLESGEKYTVVVYGDINSDGIINSNDIASIIENNLGKREITGLNRKAANLDNSNDEDDLHIDSKDIQKIKDFILKKLENNIVDVLPEEIMEPSLDDEIIIDTIDVSEDTIKIKVTNKSEKNIEKYKYYIGKSGEEYQ